MSNAASPTTPTLIALTEEARQALGGKATVRVARFPFRVGRESRAPRSAVSPFTAAVERRFRKVPHLNDLYLLEPPTQHGFHVSREHFMIDQLDYRYVVTDRNSTCGTWVGTCALGMDGAGQADLLDGDVIIVGSRQSPYQYQFRLLSND